MAFPDLLNVSKEIAEKLNILCPRCNKISSGNMEYRINHFESVGDLYYLVFSEGKIKLFKDTGNFFDEPSGIKEFCGEAHGWIKAFGFCQTCEDQGNARLYDVVFRLSDGIVDRCQVGLDTEVNPILGIKKEVKDESINNL